MVINNRRGWLRIFEAVIAIMIVMGVLLLFYKNDGPSGDFSKYVSDLELRILGDISSKETLRGFVLQGNESEISKFILTNLPSNLNFSVKICDLNQLACSPQLTIEKNLYIEERIIGSSLDSYDPKIVRLFVWEK